MEADTMLAQTTRASALDLRFGLNQERVIAQVYIDAYHPNCVLVEQPTFSPLDFAVYNPTTKEVVAYVEVKARRVCSTKYPDTMVYYGKYTHALTLKCPVVGIIKFTDRIGFFDLKKPARTADVIRRDRVAKSVRHAFYDVSSFTFIEPRKELQ